MMILARACILRDQRNEGEPREDRHDEFHDRLVAPDGLLVKGACDSSAQLYWQGQRSLYRPTWRIS